MVFIYVKGNYLFVPKSQISPTKLYDRIHVRKNRNSCSSENRSDLATGTPEQLQNKVLKGITCLFQISPTLLLHFHTEFTSEKNRNSYSSEFRSDLSTGTPE